MPKAAKLPETFEAGVTELESLIENMEAGKLTLEAQLAAYERGMALLKFCETRLADAEQQIKILNEKGELDEFSVNA